MWEFSHATLIQTFDWYLHWSLLKPVINLDFQMALYQANELAHKLSCRQGFNWVSFLYQQSKTKTPS